ncbi:MAG: hypothetical protein JRJ85_01940 [Deltaproteobacteria bacterium]|nr:hypothetical protein [Deltaproteobacteria bacterium]
MLVRNKLAFAGMVIFVLFFVIALLGGKTSPPPLTSPGGYTASRGNPPFRDVSLRHG